MINVCNLYSEFFNQVLSGGKTVEYRKRKKPNSPLESVAILEKLYFLECGTDRIIETEVTHKVTINNFLFTRYEIEFKLIRVFEQKLRKIQGWNRREQLELT